MSYTGLLSRALWSRGYPSTLFFLDYVRLSSFSELPFRRLSRPRILILMALLSRSRFRISMPSFANTAISSIAAHFVHTNSGSTDALSQNGLMFSGFIENPGGCAMSYR